jgi:hypothetical protein
MPSIVRVEGRQAPALASSSPPGAAVSRMNQDNAAGYTARGQLRRCERTRSGRRPSNSDRGTFQSLPIWWFLPVGSEVCTASGHLAGEDRRRDARKRREYRLFTAGRRAIVSMA